MSDRTRKLQLNQELRKEAEDLEGLLPRLMRHLFSFDPDRAATEIPLAQLRICTILQGGPRTACSLSDELGISPSAVTQVVDRLERADLVERIADSDDRRLKELRLTPRGAELMQTRQKHRIQRVADTLSRLNPAERERALEGVRLLLAAAQRK